MVLILYIYIYKGDMEEGNVKSHTSSQSVTAIIMLRLKNHCVHPRIGHISNHNTCAKSKGQKRCWDERERVEVEWISGYMWGSEIKH